MDNPDIVNPESAIAELVGTYAMDPLGFIMAAFPWGKDPRYSLVKLKAPWSDRYNSEYGPDEWTCQMLDEVGRQCRANDFDGAMAVDPVRIAVASGHGIGKLISNDVRMDTPMGVIRWGDVKVGDLLWGPDGKPTRVIGIPYKGTRPCYRVTFDDGSSTIAGREHLWTVRGRAQRRTDRSAGPSMQWVTLETQEILRVGVTRPNGAAQARQWEIPAYEAVGYPEAKLPIHPYLFGVMLGDAHMPTATVCTSGDAIRERLDEIGIKTTPRDVSDRNAYAFYVNGAMAHLRALGVADCTSVEKFIPDVYKHAGIEQRKELLRGLIDTDGDVTKAGSVTFNTSSERLAHDVVWLARSLGCKAHEPRVKIQTYTYKGEKRQGKPAYRMTLTFPDSFGTVCYVEHKRERIKPVERRYLTRWISGIEYVGDLEGTCVAVDREDGLFLANDFIVTHNSFTTGLLLWWILSTRPFCKGTVTANTMGQLQAKTWAQFASMQGACITGHWFEINTAKGSMRAYHKEFPTEWFVSAQTSKEENSEAFAGQHAANSTSFFILDEASGIPDKIWEVAEGGLTDGEPMIFAFGNPTRNVGQFYNCFHRDRNRWTTWKVDSRMAQLTNKKQIEEWRQAYGEDSDFFRVRVLGEFPSTSTAQLIPTDAVDDAMMREKPGVDGSSFLQAFIGLDVARFGDDATVLCTRVGRDAASVPWQTMRGLDGRQVGERAHAHAQQLLDDYGFQTVRINFDRAGIGAAVDEYFRYHNMDPRIRVNAVDFGSGSRWPLRYLNKRAEMWSLMKDWLVKQEGVIPKDEELKEQLIAPEYQFTPKGQIQLEAKKDIKKRLGVSPDCFVAGTLVRTKSGDKPIETIKEGDEVLTPVGYRKVVKTWEVETNRVTTVRFSNGSTLSGKGAHKVFTFDRGWVRMDALALTNDIEVLTKWRLFKWAFLRRLCTKERCFSFKQRVGTISRDGRISRSGFFTAGCGLTLTGRFLKGLTSITKMVTGRTTI